MSDLARPHLDDLHASGLTPETIASGKFKSVPPSEIPGKAESAYLIPHFNLNGSINCYSRMKFIPAVQDKDGHTQKYWQEPGSSPHLYLHPRVDWRTVAKNPNVEMVVTEGEKKGAAGCQHGLNTAAIGGNWTWASTLDTGEKLVLPMLDEFIWTNRPVLICPDSDAWPETEKALQILKGFFALAKELQQRGAAIEFVVLPDQHGVKCGLDDWLLVPGHDVEHSWPKLERIPLDAARFNTLNAWWQKRQARQNAVVAIRQHDMDDLDLSDTAGVYTVRSVKHTATLTFARLTDQRGTVYAELTVRLGATDLLDTVDVNLKNDTAHEKHAKSLNTYGGTVPWKLLLQKACALVLRRYRAGEPIVALQPAASATVPFRVNPIVHEGHPALWYAPGGSVKSYGALYLALLACHGAHQNGLSAIACPVLYCDWELNAETVGGRLAALRAGHPELCEYVPYYRRCELPLHQEAHHIAHFVAEHGVKLLILDSAAMACGGDLNSPDTVIKLTRALRMIGCSSLLLAHISKMTPEGHERTAFGSVYFRELTRNVWELERAEGDSPVRLILTQKKNNFGPTHPPLGLAFTFGQESVRVTACDPAEEPAFEDKLPLVSRIRNLLEDGTPRTTQQITDTLSARLGSVKATLSSYNKTKWHRIGDYHNGTWTVLSR